MKYKILILTMAENDSFRKCVSSCPDKEKLIIVNNWDNEEMGKQCDELRKQGAEIINHPENLGCGPGMNIGLRRIESGEIDYCIILSPSAMFTNSVQDFVDIIEAQEKINKEYYYQTVANHKTDLHAFAVMKKFVDEIGLYDENFFPVYYEDTDICRRMGLIGATKFLCYPDRVSTNLGGGVKGDTRIFDLYWRNVDHIHDYYVRKWGGEHTFEVFKTPFNNPNLTIKDWTVEEDQIVRRWF